MTARTTDTGAGTLAAIAAVLALAAALPWLVGDYLLGVAFTVAMWIALTQSWSVLSALSGYVSLGHVVFYGLGAYVAAAGWGVLPIPALLAAAALVAALFALAVGYPVLRVRGPYFVILTFGVAELAKYVVIAIEAASGNASRMLLGAPELGTVYALMLALAAAACALAWGVRRTRLGEGLRALRENEEAAETLGVPVARYKLAAFVLSAPIPAAVGAVVALRSTYFEPALAFDPLISFTMIAMAIIGGSDDTRGPLVGALALTLLSELLWANAPQLYQVILGLLLVAFVLFMPEGVLGRFARTRRSGA